MTIRRHVVITGTGRAGTTFLVELFTHLGLETGFNTESILRMKDQHSSAGLERDIRNNNCPFIVKSPWFCDYAEQVMSRDDISIEHVFIPIRDLNAAAESRRHVTRTGIQKLPFFKRFTRMVKPNISNKFTGGLWHTKSIDPGKQEDILVKQLYKLMLAISEKTTPVTLIRYPRLTQDCPYLFGKLEPVLQGFSFEQFCETFHNVVRPELVHNFNENDR